MEPVYEIASNETLGRYMVARCGLKKGDIIFQEFPLVIGPEKGSCILCPGCFQLPTEDKCPYCGWPLCSQGCDRIELHQDECNLFASKYKLSPQSINPKVLTDCLMIIRCLLFKTTNNTKWSQLQDMETNWKEWSESELYPRGKDLAAFLQAMFPVIGDEFTSEEIMMVQAALDINAYEVRMPEVNVQAMYPLARLVEHNCIPNTHKTISSTTMQLTLRAAVDIPEGSNITTSYCDVLWPTSQRQQYLRWSKFFICSCARCKDPSELNSELSSLLCQTCPCPTPSRPQLESVPLTLSQKEIPISFKFKCCSCSTQIHSQLTDPLLSKAEAELLELDKEQVPEKVGEYEKWLLKWTAFSYSAVSDRDQRSVLLHPNHSLVLDCCHTLFLLYSKDDSTPKPELVRKIELGFHLLSATEKLLLGISKFRGTVMYELAMTQIALLINEMEASELVDTNCKAAAEESLRRLSTSLDLLQYEPLDQPEGILAFAGRKQLVQLEAFLSAIIPNLTLAG